MNLSEVILYKLSNIWPNPIKEYQKRLGDDPSSYEYNMNYALRQQYDFKVKNGIKCSIRDMEILEIGCGHGGIAAFLAVNGAKSVVGIDLNTFHLEVARRVTSEIESKYESSYKLPLDFMEMNAYELQFENESFDIVFADNVFEHFMAPEKVMKEAWRVLRQNGQLIVPTFSSIYSKYALHLKNGLKVPWANLFFSEKSICNVMTRRIKENPWLAEIYPGYVNNPVKVRDLRRYRDLNEITFGEFKRMADRTGFRIQSFKISPAPFIVGKVLERVPFLSKSVLCDIFSISASSVLVKK